MYYLKGNVVDVLKDRIIVENNDIGYEILVSRTQNYLIGEYRTIFTYNHTHEDKSFIVGFENIEDKKLFLQLINVNGLGPKSALSILRNATTEEIYNAIYSNNSNFFKKIPGIGNKCASQIVLDLHSRVTNKQDSSFDLYNEVYATLLEFGFKRASIENVLSEINLPNATTEEIIKIALCKLGK